MKAKFFNTVDVIIEKGNKIVLVARAKEPFKGKLALPGGHLEENESVGKAALREAEEETGLKIKLKGILGVYSQPGRDPRGQTVTTVFIARAVGGKLKAKSDAEGVILISPEEIESKELAFDHGKILSDYMKWKKEKQTYWSTK